MDLLKILIIGFCIGIIVQDLIKRKVSNQIIVFAFFLTLGTIYFTKGIGTVVMGLQSLLAVLSVGYVLWRFRVLGAGDIKAMAVIALVLTWERSLEFVFCSFIWGSLLGVISLLQDRHFLQESRALHFHPILTIRSHRFRNHKVPFTVALLFGVLSVWLLTAKGVYFL